MTYIVAPVCEKDIGFLPGTVDQKVQVYNTPLYQALIEADEQPERVIAQNGDIGMKNGEWVEFIPHTFLRGANLKNRVVILDECQNYSVIEMRKVLTRCSDTSKVICIGHNGQRDAHTEGKSAFTRYMEHFAGDDRAAFCPLIKNYRGWIANHADSLPNDE
jgi:phosphate starvation-inducible PhoH-like protein